MTEAVQVALIISIPTTIASVASLIVSLKNNKSIKEVHLAINSGLTRQIEDARSSGELQGRKDSEK